MKQGRGSQPFVGATCLAVSAALLLACSSKDPAPTAAHNALNSCATFSLVTNTYNNGQWWGTITFKNNGPSAVTNYRVEFDLPSGVHCTGEPESIPPGSTLTPALTGSNPPHTPGNHCVFTWLNAPSLAVGATKTFNYSTDSQSVPGAANVIMSDPACGVTSCTSIGITHNTYNGSQWWGTITFKNTGSATSTSYKVEFDVPSGKHCTGEPASIPPGATLAGLTGSNPPRTASNHCVFTWANGPSLAPDATKTFNYSTDTQSFSSASNVVATDLCAGCSLQNPDPPLAPTGLTAAAGVNRLTLTWNAVAGATSYTVKRAPDDSGEPGAFTEIATVTGTSHMDSGLSTNRFYYTVSATSPCGTSGDAPPIAARANPRYCDMLRGTFFCDDFEDGDAITPMWTPRQDATSGGFSVISDGSFVYARQQTGSASSKYVSSAGGQWTNGSVEAKVKVLQFGAEDDDYVALFARYNSAGTDVGGYYVALQRNNKVRIKRKDNTALGSCLNATWPNTSCEQSFTITPGVWYTVKLVLDGSKLTLYINGQKVEETVDSQFAGPGILAIGSFGTSKFEVDDVTVYTALPSTCISPDDTDTDGTPDCLDGCPYDNTKTKPGVCNCGLPDTDSDGDGVADCLDECPTDPGKTGRGQCGCADSATTKPAGAPCSDTACPQTGATTCTATGTCGSSAGCAPGPDCKLITRDNTAYWFCGVFSSNGKLARASAQTSCKAKGMTLVRVESLAENEFIQRLAKDRVWVGGNSLATAGDWRWSTPTTDSGEKFWAGGASGSRVGDPLVRWRTGAPGSERCTVLNASDGAWTDVNCTTVLGYVCAHRATIATHVPTVPPGSPAQPPAGSGIPCVDEANSGLPTGEPDAGRAQLLQEIDDANLRMNFHGAAANPPAMGSTCPEDPKANALGDQINGGCQLTNRVMASKDCLSDADCSAFGPNFVCRQVKADPNCKPPMTNPGHPIQGQTCPGFSICGTIECPSTTQFPGLCDQIEVCNPGSEADAGVDPGSKLDPTPLNPTQLVQGGAPDAAPSPAYDDPHNTGTGTSHPWCRMKTQNPDSVPPAGQADSDKNGQSGGGSKIKFNFDPNLVFDIDANPLAFGETNMSLHAEASLLASVSLNGFLGQSFEADIIKAVAAINARRCSLRTDATLQILGFDFVDNGQLPKFNTDDAGNPLHNLSQKCNDALAKYQVWAGRVKKAFRDAQQLLDQYHELKKVGKILSSNLCETLNIVDLDVPEFPGGAVCYPNETVESIINRFIEYYQGPGTGQASKFRQIAGGLAAVSSALSGKLGVEKKLDFIDKKFEESQTILNVPFAIGPIPMVLQVDIMTSYGIAGRFAADVRFPLNLEGASAPPMRVAHVTASVLPHASAGLSAFVGAGFDYGAFSAAVGLEGAVSLAEIQAPLFAGAGLDMEVLEDIRPIPTDVKPPVSLALNAFQFGIPKAFKFSASYDYGLAVDVNNVLAGEIKAKLKIKFAFFSRTWRKRVVKFNGWSKHFDLLKGGGSTDISVGSRSVPNTAAPPDTASTTAVAEGRTSIGRSESEVPLMRLAKLETAMVSSDLLPDGGAPDGPPPVPFNSTKVEKMFYDDLCCAKPTQACRVNGDPFPECCPGATCVVPMGAASGTCQVQCGAVDTGCESDNDCCQNQNMVCGSAGKCRVCAPSTTDCGSDDDCCDNLLCLSGKCGQYVE